MIASSTHDVLVLVTDTAHDDAERTLQSALERLPDLQGLTLTRRIPTYSPTWVELTVSEGLWALGAFVFTVLAKAAIAIEVGRSRWRAESDGGRSRVRADAGVGPVTPVAGGS